MKGGLIGIMILISGMALSQRTIRFAQLNFVQGINNPAAIAVDGKIMVDLVGRSQWFGFEGAPNTYGLNAQYEIVEEMAVGLNVYHDQIGVNQTTSIRGQYAYRLYRYNGDVVALGLGLGIDNFLSDYASTFTITPDDPAFQSSYYKTVFNAAVGLYYYSPKYYVGISSPHLFYPKAFTGGKTKLYPEPHVYMSAGFYIDAGENFTLNPNLQVKYVESAPIAGDLIIRNTFYGRFSVIVGYRTENSIVAGLDVLITPMCRAGYSFNYDVGKLSRAKGMSNELYLGFAFPYHSDRSDFGKRRYVSNKGGFRRDYKRQYHQKHKIRHNRYH